MGASAFGALAFGHTTGGRRFGFGPGVKRTIPLIGLRSVGLRRTTGGRRFGLGSGLKRIVARIDLRRIGLGRVSLGSIGLGSIGLGGVRLRRIGLGGVRLEFTTTGRGRVGLRARFKRIAASIALRSIGLWGVRLGGIGFCACTILVLLGVSRLLIASRERVRRNRGSAGRLSSIAGDLERLLPHVGTGVDVASRPVVRLPLQIVSLLLAAQLFLPTFFVSHLLQQCHPGFEPELLDGGPVAALNPLQGPGHVNVAEQLAGLLQLRALLEVEFGILRPPHLHEGQAAEVIPTWILVYRIARKGIDGIAEKFMRLGVVLREIGVNTVAVVILCDHLRVFGQQRHGCYKDPSGDQKENSARHGNRLLQETSLRLTAAVNAENENPANCHPSCCREKYQAPSAGRYRNLLCHAPPYWIQQNHHPLLL